MKEKLLFIAPHLSTGGMPQYLLRQIEEFLPKYNINVIEVSNLSNEFVVQKNKIKEIVPIFTLNENKEEIIDIIHNISPNIIHFHEIPEFYLNDYILDSIFSKDRSYKIISTTHGSNTNPNDIRYHPDKYILVSEWSKKQFMHLDIPISIWEYPITKKRPNKDDAKSILNFDKDYKHILHVGLFTPGKNQKEIIEVARLCQDEKFKFHFVGNMADNFSDYWKPLLNDLPKNCILHGEKDDTDIYYAASDVFYFPSIYELNPLSLKEAVENGLPIITKNLHTYENYYDSRAKYSTDDPNENKKILIDLLNETPTKNEDEITIVLAHTNNLFRENILNRCLASINTDIILSCNFPVNKSIQSLCNYVLYSSDNQLLLQKEFNDHNVIIYNWVIKQNGEKEITPHPFEHSYAVYNLIKQGLQLANNLNKKKIHIVNYDVIPDNNVLKENYKILDNYDFKFFLNYSKEKTQIGYKTNFFSGNIEPLLYYFNLYQTKKSFYVNFKIFEEKTHDVLKNENFKINEDELIHNTLFDLEGVHEFSGNDLYHTKIKINQPNININFVDGPFFEILGGSNIDYDVTFKDKKTNNIVYKTKLKRNNWAKATKKYFIDWQIEMKSKYETKIFDFTLEHKKILISIDSKSLGDNIAWMPYIEEFRKKHNCIVIASTFWNELFKNKYKEIEFVSPGSVVNNIYAFYKIGWFYNPEMEPMLPNTIPLQMSATNILGLNFNEIKPDIDFTPNKRPIKKKYITIATKSTAQLKLWSYPNAWDILSEYLMKNGYEVVNLSKEGNDVPNTKTPENYDIKTIMNYIHHSEFFIGLASGLSWLAWALNKHVVMISNFTPIDHEFTTNTTRIINQNTCNSCWTNPNFKFDKGDWNWCPIHKNTPRQHECHKLITPEFVINQINHLL